MQNCHLSLDKLLSTGVLQKHLILLLVYVHLLTGKVTFFKTLNNGILSLAMRVPANLVPKC